MQSSDNYFFEQIVGQAPENYWNVVTTNTADNNKKILPCLQIELNPINIDYNNLKSEYLFFQKTSTLSVAEQQLDFDQLTLCDNIKNLHVIFILKKI